MVKTKHIKILVHIFNFIPVLHFSSNRIPSSRTADRHFWNENLAASTHFRRRLNQQLQLNRQTALVSLIFRLSTIMHCCRPCFFFFSSSECFLCFNGDWFVGTNFNYLISLCLAVDFWELTLTMLSHSA